MSERKYVTHDDFPNRLLTLQRVAGDGKLALVEVATGSPEWVGSQHWVRLWDIQDVSSWDVDKLLNRQEPLRL